MDSTDAEIGIAKYGFATQGANISDRAGTLCARSGIWDDVDARVIGFDDTLLGFGPRSESALQ